MSHITLDGNRDLSFGKSLHGFVSLKRVQTGIINQT